MKNRSDQLVQMLVDAGVKYTFGIPGDAINLILASICERKDIEFTLTCHEEAAGFMASAYAKLTGKMAVLFACQGPGSAHLLEAMYDAKMDKVPMLVITGQIESAKIGTNTVQEINQILLFEDSTIFNREVRSAHNLFPVLQLAIQMALVHKSVAHVSIATDVLKESAGHYIPNMAAFNLPHTVIADENLIKQAADILNEKEKVTILYGGGCLYAKEELSEVADLLAAPMVHTVRSKDIIDNNNPHYAGGIGFKGSKNGCDCVKNCDALLIVGCSFAWREYYPEDVPIIQIDIDPHRMGVNSHLTIGLLGDAHLTLKQLKQHLTKKSKTEFLQKAQTAHIKAIANLGKKAEVIENRYLDSAVVTQLVSDNLTENAIVTVDAGTISVWANNFLRLNGIQRLIGSTELGTMGFALPAALACQLAKPDQLVVALTGDGGFKMTMADFSTAVQYNLPIKVIIYNNFSLRFIELEQMKEGITQCYTKLHNPNFALMAEAFGGEGYTVTEPLQLEPTLNAAFSSKNPCIIDVHVNPDELIEPNKINFSMVKNYLKSEIMTKLFKT